MSPAPNAPISFRAAAEALQQPDRSGRALKAMVLKREGETGDQIARRLAGKKQPKMRVTLTALYFHFPEFKPPRTSTEVLKSTRAYVEAIDARISEVTAAKVQELVMPMFREDRKRLDELETTSGETVDAVEDLARQLATITGAKKAG